MKNRLLLWFAVLLAASLLMPNHYPPWLSFHSEVVAAAAFSPIMVWAVLRDGTLPAVAVGGFALALVPIVQLAFGQISFAGDAWIALLYLAGFALATVAGGRCVDSGTAPPQALDFLIHLWIALVVAGYLSVGIALHQWLSLGLLGILGADLPPGGRAFGNLAQPNQLATLLLMGLAGHVALFEGRKLSAVVSVLGALFLVCGLLLTGSRSVLLSLAWLWPAFCLMRRRCSLRTHPGALFGVSLFFAVGSVLWPALNELLLLGSHGPSAIYRDEALGIRGIYWASMLDAIWRAPWQGYGWNQIGLAQTDTALDFPATNSYFYSSHNLLLDLLLWNGIPVGLTVIAGLGAWVVWQLRQCRDPMSWTAMTAIGFVCSHAMVEYPLSYTYFLLPVGFLVGALSTTHLSSMDKHCGRWMPPLQRLALTGIVVLGTGLLAKVCWEYPTWEQDWRYLRFEEAHIGDPERIELPTIIVLTQLDELMKFSRSEAKPGMSASELDWMQRVSTRFGHSSGMYRYALALALNNRATDAVMAMRRLCQMQPKSTCQSARRHWVDLTRNKYPQLAQVPFPSPVAAPADRAPQQ